MVRLFPINTARGASPSSFLASKVLSVQASPIGIPNLARILDRTSKVATFFVSRRDRFSLCEGNKVVGTPIA
jgi:hypothetical protein